MADVKSKLVLDIETNARQAQGELSSMAQSVSRAEIQRSQEILKQNRLVQQRFNAVKREVDLANRMNTYLEQRKQKEQQINATVARRPGGGGKGIGGVLGQLGGAGFLGSQVGSLASGVISGNTGSMGQSIGGTVGAGLGLATTLIPGIGPAISAAVTPVLTSVLGSIGALFDKENAKRDAAEAAKTQKEAAELQRKAAEEQMRAAKQANLDKYIASLEKLLAGTQDAARRTAIEQEIKHVEASGEIPEGGWRKYAIDMEKERQEFLQFVKDMNALVKAGVLSKGDAQRRIEGAKPPSDVLATGSVSTYETYLGVD